MRSVSRSWREGLMEIKKATPGWSPLQFLCACQEKHTTREECPSRAFLAMLWEVGSGERAKYPFPLLQWVSAQPIR